ncbi:MAG: SDR family oxidoreductase [Sphingobacteriales bacterium]|nr:SDR family oxidoreductase [Sphingobacteriales bacterium]
MNPSVLILGATSDIGMALAEKFAQNGYPLVLAARNSQRLAPLQSDLEIKYGTGCEVLEFDITHTDTHQATWDKLQEKPGITICVAGYMNENERVIKDTAETLKTIATNFTGPVALLNIIAADYAEKGKGIIAGISSVAGLRGRQSNYIYGSAKAGFTAYLSGLRNRMYSHGVHVLTVLPGFMDTKMTAHLKLPRLLTAQPARVADAIYRGILKKKNTIYIKWFWKWIMFIIRHIPESIFKKKKL